MTHSATADLPHSRRRFPAERALYRAAQVRALDAAAIRGGIDGFELMRRAGAALLRVYMERWPASRELLVFTGPGNNGGDGFVVAALAAQQGVAVKVIMLSAPERLKGDARKAYELALEMADANGLSLLDCQSVDVEELLSGASESTLILDAMLGTGISGELSEPYAGIVAAINRSGLPVIAADIPTGLDSDTGAVAGDAVSARVTVTFIGLKQGLFTAAGPDRCGDIVFDRLDVPASAYESAEVGAPTGRRLDIQAVLPMLRPRPFTAHKGDCGHVLVVGGDSGFGGAAIMAAEAAARAGAGTVTLITREEHVAAMLTRRPEIMTRGVSGKSLAEREAFEAEIDALLRDDSVIVLGPGLGQSAWSRQLLQSVLRVQQRRDLPMVLDADALNLLAVGHDSLAPDISLPQAKWVITPHPGEAARLLGSDTATVQKDRFAAAAGLQEKWAAVVLLKGAGTVIASGSEPTVLDVCTEGNPGMASGGMGDVLAGITGGLMTQFLHLELGAADAVRCAACVHGESADLAAADSGQRGMLASDLLPYVQALVSQELKISSGAFLGR